MKIKILTVMSLLLLILGWYRYDMEKTYKEDIKSFQDYTKQASRLIDLQKKWTNKEEDKKLIEDLNRRFKPSSYKVEKDIHILKFEGLTKSTLNRLGKMILNSNLFLKKIDLDKKDGKISLLMEIKI